MTETGFLLQLQAFFLVADDIMDNSITRRGQPCWYRVKKVCMRRSWQLHAVSDQLYTRASIQPQASCRLAVVHNSTMLAICCSMCRRNDVQG